MKPPVVASLLRTLATPRRVILLKLILDHDGPASSTLLSASSGLNDQQLSYNMKALCDARLVYRTPSGQWVLYSLNRKLLVEIGEFFELVPR